MSEFKVKCPYCAMEYPMGWIARKVEKIMNYPNCPSTYCRVFRRSQ